MHAIRLHAFGPAENLRYERVEDPEPGPGQVRVSVAAAGVHLLDTALREGLRQGPLPLPELPTVPGREIAGTVDALGEGVDAHWLGRRVVAHLGRAPGGYAERAVVGTDALHRIPAGLAEPDAVAMIGTGRTTVGILHGAGPGPADTVLVLAAAGGIGSLLVQYAKHRGARVIGAAGGPVKTATVEKLGADLAVDYTVPGWAGTVRAALGERPATRLYEGVGGTLARTAVELLAPGGVHVPYGYASTGPEDGGMVELSEEEQRARGVSSRPLLGPAMLAHKRAYEEEAMALAAAGTLVPLVQSFPLAEAARAHRALAGRGTVGKVVLLPGT